MYYLIGIHFSLFLACQWRPWNIDLHCGTNSEGKPSKCYSSCARGGWRSANRGQSSSNNFKNVLDRYFWMERKWMCTMLVTNICKRKLLLLKIIYVDTYTYACITLYSYFSMWIFAECIFHCEYLSICTILCVYFYICNFHMCIL